MNDGMNLGRARESHRDWTDEDADKVPISLRAGMAELSKRLGISQLALVRSALAAFLVANEAPVVPLVAPEVIAEAQPEEATEVIAEAQPEAQTEEATEAQPEAQTPAPPPQAATEANAARAARHRSKLLSRKPTETRKPRTKQANS